MFRFLLIASLVASQGSTSLGGTTLCLHADGGFCLEQPSADCRHHESPAVASGCCGHSHEQPADERPLLGATPCDCMHLAIAGDPQIAAKRSTEVQQDDLNLGAIVVNLIAFRPASLAATEPRAGPQTPGIGGAAPLSFLEPVMLRC